MNTLRTEPIPFYYDNGQETIELPHIRQIPGVVGSRCESCRERLALFTVAWLRINAFEVCEECAP